MQKFVYGLLLLIFFTGSHLASAQQALEKSSLDFEYEEEDLLPGKTIFEKLSHVSQIDKLERTKTDYARCSAAACLNAYLVMEGDWKSLFESYGKSPDLSFTNIHHLQDTLVLLAESDNQPGIYGSFKPKWDDKGKYESWYMPEGVELPYILKALNLKYAPLLGPSKKKEYLKKKRVKDFFKKHPTGVLLMGVHEDMKTGKSTPIREGALGNHYIICYKKGKDYHFLDTWRKPGQRSNGVFTKEEVQSMLFNTRNMLVGLHFEN